MLSLTFFPNSFFIKRAPLRFHFKIPTPIHSWLQLIRKIEESNSFPDQNKVKAKHASITWTRRGLLVDKRAGPLRHDGYQELRHGTDDNIKLSSCTGHGGCHKLVLVRNTRAREHCIYEKYEINLLPKLMTYPTSVKCCRPHFLMDYFLTPLSFIT